VQAMVGSYSYDERRGVRDVSWTMFYGLCKGLALAAAPFAPEVVVGLARGGLYPAMQIAHLMRIDIVPARLTRRIRDTVVRADPVWLSRPGAELAAKRVLVVDEICDSGQTLRMARDEVLRVGSAEVRTCVLYAHTRRVDVPDFVGLVTDELVLNPWDREILVDDRFVAHPEYLGAGAAQGIRPELLTLGVEPIAAAKG
jgi:hypoxanthine phosphoribosyltransferase